MTLYTKSKAKNIISDKDQINNIVMDTLDKMATIVAILSRVSITILFI